MSNNDIGPSGRSSFAPVRSGSVRSKVVEALREAIYSGKLQPGEQIRESHMARALQVSQPTIREALLQLEHAGLVVRSPNRETTVTKLSGQDIRERAALRSLLEGLAAVEAAAKMSEADFSLLQAHLGAIHQALEKDSYMEYVAADQAFHRLIWQLSGNRTLGLILNLITIPLFAFLSIQRSRQLHDLVRQVRSHDPILEAMRRKEPETIRQAFRTHIEGSYAHFSEL